MSWPVAQPPGNGACKTDLVFTTFPILREIGRVEHEIDITVPLIKLQTKRVLVTGANGAIGQPLVRTLRKNGISVVPTDIDTSNGVWGCQKLDVTSFQSVLEMVAFHDPDLIINAAAAKLAPAGEVHPYLAANINVNGMKNLLDMGRPVVQMSTCKAVAACTAYGASKLLAERMVLNAGGTVIRFYNIPTAGPSMLTIWQDLPEDDPIPVTGCTRYLMSEREAVALTVYAATFLPGRYAVDPGPAMSMTDYAECLYPGREQVQIPARRGDRIDEPLIGDQEWIEELSIPYIRKIHSWHDA